MVQSLFLLTVALMFGGMVLYSFGFAAFLFSSMSAESAGPLLRKAFPHFYTFVVVTALVGAGFAGPINVVAATLLLMVAATAITARQFLMPAINRATDTGAKTRFKYLHTISVLVTLSHIVAAAYILVGFT
jgi:hypothetical protein